MTIQDLGALGEFLSSIVVLLTLGYLAFQTRQNTMAISAQLDGARLSAIQNIRLAAATSNEVAEALNEDRRDPPPISQARCFQYWGALLLNFQWQFQQAGRGLLPSFNEAGLGRHVGGMFKVFRSFEGWWECSRKFLYVPEFVAWVEEQRAKATTSPLRW